MLVGYSLVIIVDNDPIIVLAASVMDIAEVTLKTGNDLFKCLFVNATSGSCWIEVQFVDAFGKEPAIAPTSNGGSDLLNQRFSFEQR